VPLGRHVILECHECSEEDLKNQSFLEKVLSDGARHAKAEILHTYFHKFDRGEGVTGVIALAESHISIHTWPEHKYMAIDVFMCGDCDPFDTLEYVVNNMKIGNYTVNCIHRGVEYK